MTTASDLPDDIRGVARAVKEMSREWNEQRNTLQEALQGARDRASVLLEPIRQACKVKQAALDDASQRLTKARHERGATSSVGTGLLKDWNQAQSFVDKDDVAYLEGLKARLNSRLTARLTALDENIKGTEAEVHELSRWLTLVRAYLASVEVNMIVDIMIDPEHPDQSGANPVPNCYEECGNFAPFPGSDTMLPLHQM